MFVDVKLAGVWFSDRPLGPNDGAPAEAAYFAIDVDEALAADYEVIEDGRSHREWRFPAAVANKSSPQRLRPVDVDRAVE